MAKRYPFQEVIDQFGPPNGNGPISAEEASRYHGRVPDALIDFWQEYGRGSWRDGLYWLCDPETLMPVVQSLFRNDPEFDAEQIVPYMRDAFGDFSAWHPKLKLITISMNLGEVSTTDITTQIVEGDRPFDDDVAIASPLAGDVFDGVGWVNAIDGSPVFEDVRVRNGSLRADQVYIMNPHFRMGGAGIAEDFSIGGLLEYEGFLSQIGSFTRMTYISPEHGGRKPYGESVPERTIGYDGLVD